jgi:Invasin, domain 3
MIRTFIRGVLGTLVIALAGCGGGTKTCVPVTGGDVCDGKTSGAGAPAELRIALSAVTLLNTPTSSLTATITAVDSGSAVVANAPITVRVDSQAEVIVSATSTDSTGKITATVTVGPNRANRVVTLTALVTGGTISRSASFSVVDASLSGTATSGIVTPGQQGSVTFKLVDAAANPIVGEAITVTAPGLPTAEAITDNDGVYRYNFTAPTTTGNLPITANAAGTSTVVSVNVQADSSVIPVVPVGSVLSSTVSANPSVVAVNKSDTANSTAVRALFVGVNNARIPNVRVRFELPDPNRVGGTLDSGSNIVYSNDSGFAETFYRPGAVPSPTNGVIVRACWGYNDAELAGGACPRIAEAQLTVVSDALRVTIGTDELVGLADTTYTKDFAVIVVDAAGRAKADVEITPSIDLIGFYKGYYVFDQILDRWIQIVTTQDGPYTWTGSGWIDDNDPATNGVCPNEDANRNGVREDFEDLNGNSELDPAGVTITNVTTSRTDAAGKAIVRIEYSRDRATWIDYRVTITATVAGSEGKAVYTGTLYGLGNLPAPGSAVSTETVFPAFGISPYGRGNTSLSGADASLCTNTK